MKDLKNIYFVYREIETEETYDLIKIGFFTTYEKASDAIDEYCEKMNLAIDDVNLWELPLDEIYWNDENESTKN